MNRIRIESNGTSHGTTIRLINLDESLGLDLPAVTSMTWTAAAGCDCVATVQFCEVALGSHAKTDLRPLVRAILDGMDPQQARDFSAELAIRATVPADVLDIGLWDGVIPTAEFDGQNTVIARDQPQYRSIPAHYGEQRGGILTFCWKPTAEQLGEIVRTGVIWHQGMLCGGKLQPQLLLASRPPELLESWKPEPEPEPEAPTDGR